MQLILTYIFLIIYTITIVGIILVVITDNRNPLKTLPWIVVLVLAPGVGLVFYFFFGQNLSKQRIISRRTRKRITTQLEESDRDGTRRIPNDQRTLARLLYNTSHAVPLYGSRITPYTEGRTKMEALLAEIARARHHIHLQYYILSDDTTGRRLCDALIAKAREGVEVRILYDDVGSRSVKKRFFARMRRAGIEVRPFLSDWSATTKQHVSGEAYFPPTEHFTNNILQIVPGSPLGKWRTLLQAYSLAISRARRRIWIQTPYYLPPDVLNTALQVAALAGIDVRMMLPARSDSKAIDYASHSYLDDMVKAGVKILFYRPGFLHSKLLIVDDTLTVIGSANMDFRSFEHNFEVCGFVYDADFTARMAAIFTDDAAQCTPLAPGKWFKRPRSHKFAESFLRLCSPLM